MIEEETETGNDLATEGGGEGQGDAVGFIPSDEQATEAIAGADAEAIQPSEPSSDASLEPWMGDLRRDIGGLEKEVRSIPKHAQFKCKESCEGQHDEMLAQAKLAVRALEEARMRLGKVLQYHHTGHSIYGD